MMTEMMLVLLVLLGIISSSCIIGTLGYQPALPPLMTMTTTTKTTTRKSMTMLRDRRTTGSRHDASNGLMGYTMNELQIAPTTTRATSRRSLLATMLTGTTTLMAVVAVSPFPAQAVLDIESFLANDKETTPYQYRTKSSSSTTGDGKTMSDDEALCRFGSPSKKVGEACVRAGMSTKRPSGVDAFGTVDRKSPSSPSNTISYSFFLSHSLIPMLPRTD